MALHLKAASKSDVGKQREQNEDACYVYIAEGNHQVAGLFVVADGMGGYHGGEIASKIAVETISEQLQSVFAPVSNQSTVKLKNRGKRGKAAKAAGRSTEAVATADTPEALPEPETPARPEGGAETQHLGETLALEHYGEKLRAAIEQSSEAIVEYGRKHPEARGLGSTVTAALVIGDQAFVANVGDSRTYLFRDGRLQRITRDHSLVERLVEAGQIEPDDVYDHPHRNLIYRSLGANKAEVEVDLFTEQLQPGDALLLCSDGLWEMVRDPQITTILAEMSDPARTGDTLVDLANENGGEDNITAVLVRYVEPE